MPAKSTSTTPSKSGCGCWRLTPYQPSERRYSARTRTGSSLTKVMTGQSLCDGWIPLSIFYASPDIYLYLSRVSPMYELHYYVWWFPMFFVFLPRFFSSLHRYAGVMLLHFIYFFLLPAGHRERCIVGARFFLCSVPPERNGIKGPTGPSDRGPIDPFSNHRHRGKRHTSSI